MNQSRIVVRLFTFSLLTLICCTVSSNAQGADDYQNRQIEPTPCAIIRNQLDRSIVEFAKDDKRFDNHKYLIIILRAGGSERSGRLIRQRIDILRKFFELRRQTKNIVIAEAERNNKRLGSGEVYINGILMERFYFKYQQAQPCSSVEESW